MPDHDDKPDSPQHPPGGIPDQLIDPDVELAERAARLRLHAAEVARYIAATPVGPPVYTVHPDHDAAEQYFALVKAELARLRAISDAQ